MAVTQPRLGVSIGFVQVGGNRIPVQVDPEYLRYFTLLGSGVNSAITDHGALTGLTDDDHPQYLNNARGDVRYPQKPTGTPDGTKFLRDDNSWQPVAGGGGNSVTVTCNFGASFTDKAQTVVTGQAWVTANSEISAQVLTPSGVDPDEIRLLDLRPVVSDLVAGVGFTVTLYSAPEAKGSYNVMCIGI